MKRNPNLDILRLILATNVVVLHCFHTGQAQLLPLVAAFVSLSGLLIPDSFSRSTSYGQFAMKRIARVGPAMLVSVALVATLYGFKWAGGTVLYYLTMGVLLPYATTKNAALWSLMLEEILYASHCVLRKLKVFWNTPTIFTIYVFLTCATLWFYAHPEFHAKGVESYRFPYAVGIAASFALGNIVCLHKERVKRFHPRIVGAFLIVALILWFMRWTRGPVIEIFTGQFATVCALIFAYVTPPVRWKFPDISYGIYVYHSPIWLLMKARGLEGFALLGVVLPIVVALSIASWFLVEAPALAWKERRVREAKERKEQLALAPA